MPRIGLCMIVKNESHVIERCLDSVKSIVNFVLVEDTGSDDDTMEIIRAWLVRNGVPGSVYFNEWKNFAQNRSSALEHLRSQTEVDYALIMDADDEFVIENPAELMSDLQSLAVDSCRIKLLGGGSEYFRTQLVSNRMEFKYKGVLHEFIEGPPNYSSSTLVGCFIRSNREGARSKDPQKYQKDAEVLRTALEIETDAFLISRYTFYLAQSLRDAGQISEAIKFYKARAEQGFWIEERYVALLNAGRMMETLAEYSSEDVTSVFNEAIKLIPSRVEAFHALARHFRIQKNYSRAFEIAMRGSAVPLPSQGLFVEVSLYKFGIKDELAVAAYWADRKELCLKVCTEIIEENFYSATNVDRIVKNGDFAADVLQKQIDQFHAVKVKKGFLLNSTTDSNDYIKLVRDARLLESEQSSDVKQVIGLYNQAIKISPDRVEARHGLLRFCRQKNLLPAKEDAITLALFTVSSQLVDDEERWILDYGMAYELCRAFFELGLNEKCIEFGLSAFKAENLPDEIRDELLDVTRKADRRIRDSLFLYDQMARGVVFLNT